MISLIEYTELFEYISTHETISSLQMKKIIFFLEQHQYTQREELLDGINHIMTGDKFIFDGKQEYSFEPILHEHSHTIDLMEVFTAVIYKNIPTNMIGLLNEIHAINIINSLSQITIDSSDNALTIKHKMNQLFEEGKILIPIHNLSNESKSVNQIMCGLFAPLIYKKITTNTISQINNTITLKQVMVPNIYHQDNTLMNLLPQFIMRMSQIVKKK